MAMFLLLYSTGQHGLIDIDESLLANSLRAIVPQRVLLKSADGATKQNKCLESRVKRKQGETSLAIL